MKEIGIASVLVAVAGQAGAGKKRLAELIARRIGARRIEVAGDQEPFPEPAAYASAFSEAATALDTDGGRIVLVGAFHTRESRRKLLRVAGATRSALLYLECSANEFVRRRRLRMRLTSGPDALTPPEAELWVNRLVSDDARFERTGFEIPRAAQMLIDTTVGVEIWGGLASSRVELWAADAAPTPRLEDQALSAG